MLWRAPAWFWLLPVVLALGAVLVALLRRRAAALAAFAEAPLAARLTPDLDRRRWTWRTGLRVAALVLLVIALAGPKWGFHWQQMKRQGLDIIVAIDTSRSMLATDVKPNRLERAKLAVLDLVPLLEGDRIGLVPFAGTAFLESPLTMDYAAFERAVRSVEVGIIPRGGTALARAIDTSLEGFDAREGKYEALILITDGEDNEGDVKAAAERAKAQGVQIFTIGIGTDEGELLPLGDGGFVKDRSGQVVKSRLDEETLKEIALTTGGAYVRGIGPSLGLDQVFRDHIAPMERREVASALQRQYEERFQIPLALALLVLVIEGLVPLRRSPRVGARRRLRRQAGAVTLCVPFLFGFLDPQGDSAAAGNQLYAAGKYDEAASKYGEGLIDAPASPLLQFNLATALYKQGKYDEAIGALQKVEASGDATWVARAAYNAGNAHYQVGAGTESSNPQATIKSWTQALVDYRRAMVADPNDVDAKFNHELVSRKLAELRKKLEEEKKRQEEQQKQQQDQQKQQQDQQQDQQDQQKQQQDQQENDQQEQAQDQQRQEEQRQDQQQQQDEDQQEQQQPGSEEQPQQQPGQDQQEQDRQGEAEQEQQAAEQQREEQAGGQRQEAEQPKVEQGQQQAAAGASGEAVPDSPEQQAARAVIDTARGEELDPLQIDRPLGVAGSGEPSRDW